jgi:hypothetical protein
MRYYPALFALVLVSGLAACGGGSRVVLPAVEPRDVQVFMPGDFPAEEYKVLKVITVTGILSRPDEEMVAEARQKAAELGADAMIIKELRMTAGGAGGLADVNPNQDRKTLEAMAVYYPAQHPELQQPGN